MECNCNDTTNKTKGEIRHVYGNVLRLAIPLTLRSLAKDGDTIVATDTDFVPSSAYPVNVVFTRGNKALPIHATMDENVAVMEDMGTIPVGTYDITVECRDDAGRPYRFKQKSVLQVVEYTADAGIEQEIEYEVNTWYLDAAIFLATTEIGSVEAEIDARLATVFGDADYDAQNRRFVFYNKSRSAILCEVDATPFVRDGMVENFYLDTSRNVLVIVLNSDGGRRTMTVPLYMAFANYYTRAEVNSRINEEVSAAIDALDIDIPTETLMTKAEYTYPERDAAMGGKIIYGALPHLAVKFIEDIGEAGALDGGDVYAAANGHIYESNYNSSTYDLGAVPNLAILNKADNLFYRYIINEGWVQVGGSGSGGGEGTVTAVKMNNGTPIEPNAQGVVDLGTVITAHQDISGKANSADLATVATSGSYNDLTNKPTIPAAYDDTTLSGRVSALENAGYVTSSTMTTALAGKQDTLTFDNAPTANSNNPVKSGGIKTAIDAATPSIDPTTKKWVVGGQLTNVVAEGQDGQDGNSGVASADGVESVNNLNGGTTDTESKVYVLGANQGKRLRDQIEYVYGRIQALYAELGNIAFWGGKPSQSDLLPSLYWGNPRHTVTLDLTMTNAIVKHNGVTKVDGDTIVVEEGSTLELTVEASSGYAISSVTSVAGTVDGNTVSLEMGNSDVTLDITAVATIAYTITYNLTGCSAPSGVTNPSIVASGGGATISLKSSSGYYLPLSSSSFQVTGASIVSYSRTAMDAATLVIGSASGNVTIQISAIGLFEKYKAYVVANSPSNIFALTTITTNNTMTKRSCLIVKSSDFTNPCAWDDTDAWKPDTAAESNYSAIPIPSGATKVSIKCNSNYYYFPALVDSNANVLDTNPSWVVGSTKTEFNLSDYPTATHFAVSFKIGNEGATDFSNETYSSMGIEFSIS